MKKLNLFGDMLLVRRDPPVTREGNVMLPQDAQYYTNIGTVVAAGPGAYNDHTDMLKPMAAKVEDKVMFHPQEGQDVTEIVIEKTDAEFRDKKTRFILLRDSMIWGTVK